MFFFFLDMSFFFNGFFCIDLSFFFVFSCFFLLTCYGLFSHQLVRVVVSSTIVFLWVFMLVDQMTNLILSIIENFELSNAWALDFF